MLVAVEVADAGWLAGCGAAAWTTCVAVWATPLTAETTGASAGVAAALAWAAAAAAAGTLAGAALAGAALAAGALAP